jgi:hypothetical protein
MFKQFEWMEENKSESWVKVGAYLVNSRINQCPSKSKDNKSPYAFYYGNFSVNRIDYDPSLLKVAASDMH